jgi:hypothetical protein
MVMDDPWGSPWADEIHQAETKPKDEAVVRPLTPVRTMGLVVQNNSPWNDDDGDGDRFGNWAPILVVEEAKEKSSGLDRGDGWEIQDTNGDATPKKDDLDETRLPWSDTTATLAEGDSSLLAEPVYFVRKPPPDPWASEITSKDGDKEEDEDQPTGEDLWGDKSRDSLFGQVTKDTDGLEPLDIEMNVSDDERHEEPMEEDVKDDDGHHDELKTVYAGLKPIKGLEETSIVQDADPGSSRPSSSPSERSHHDEILSESPRTSLDEEPRRPKMGRKVSSKVQTLVRLFDGLAKPDAVSEMGLSDEVKHPEETQNDAAESDNGADFGDFEDGASDLGNVNTEGEAQLFENSTISLSQLNSDSKDPQTSRPPNHRGDPPPTRDIKKDYGPVEFTVDTSAFDKIFSDTARQIQLDTTAAKLFMPDTIIDNTFSSTKQRKTWYRISRYGTMRKHNTGDDENYVRINWAQSQVRVETLKIVARWIEEDRISGRVVLGGSSKVGSMFGWNDTSPTPVPISSALASRREGKKSHPKPDTDPEVPREWPKGLVTARTPPKGCRRSSTKPVRLSSEVKPEMLPMPVPKFGWSTVPESQPESKQQISLSGSILSPDVTKSPPQGSSTSSTQPLPTMTIPKVDTTEQARLTNPSALASPTSSSSKIHVPIMLPTLPIESLNNDDDDWGEMMSSPIVATIPAFSPPKELRHKKSTSLGEFSSIIPATAAKAPPISSLKSRRGHEPAMGFDKILSPRIISPCAPDSTPSTKQTSTPNIAVASFQDSQSPKTTMPPPAAASNFDPWASADFSFFDSTPAPVPMPALAPKITPAKTVIFGNTLAAPRPAYRTGEEIEQDRIVESIIQGLPDLSYMLRR